MAEVLENDGILERWIKPYLYFKCPNCSSVMSTVVIREDANSSNLMFLDGQVMGVQFLCPRCLENIIMQKPCANLKETRR